MDLQRLLLIQQLSNRYDQEKEYLENVISFFQDNLLTEYSRRFPLRIYSKHIVSNFLKNLSNCDYLPPKEKYIEYHTKFEYFDITLSFSVRDNNPGTVWGFPYPINIHKVTNYIAEKNIQKSTFSTSALAQLINPECFDEFDEYMESQRYWNSIIGDIKANNPVIVLCEGGIVGRPYLINGTHRTIQAIKESRETVDAFVVSCDICKTCSMTKAYEKLYLQITDMCDSAHGFKKGLDISYDSSKR